MRSTTLKRAGTEVELRALRSLAEEQMRQMRFVLAQITAALGDVSPRPSALDEIKEIIDSTRDLRAASGNLSATAIASAFGVSINQLAVWLGRTRQAICKTPDADSLQNELGLFERVARLRVVVAKDRFLKWLRMPNSQLEGDRPLDLLAKGERQVVADLVTDMLTGSPI
jgi:hypothetical protein